MVKQVGHLDAPARHPNPIRLAPVNRPPTSSFEPGYLEEVAPEAEDEKASAAIDRLLDGSVMPEEPAQSAQSADLAQSVESRKPMNISHLKRKKSTE